VTRSVATTAAVTIVAAVLAAGCGSSGGSATPAATSAPATTTAPVVISVAGRRACAVLLAQLQRVTLAIASSSELVARSVNRSQLVRRIGIEQQQLVRSAELIVGSPVPASLAATRGDLVQALVAYSRDFARAHGVAAKGDYKGASAAMSDAPVARRIVRDSKTISSACR
jgi:hypothetical protein